MHRFASLGRLGFALALFFLPFDHVSAAEHRAEGQLRVAADEVIEDDLYCFGDEITIDGRVKGDVVAFGRLVRINGTVEGDLIGAAQAIVINGTVNDDIRIAGQVLKLDEECAVGDDVFAAGFSLQASEGSSVDGELVFAGYQALLAGRFGDVTAGLVNCEISGTLDGDVKLEVGRDETGAHAYTGGSPPPISFPNVPPGLTIRDTARIAGGLEYEAPSEADIAAGAEVVGETTHELQPAEPPPTPAEKIFSVLRRSASLLVVGLGALLIVPTWINGMSENVKARPATCLGLGAAGIGGFVVSPLIILVAMVVLAVLAGFLRLTGLVPVFIVLGLSSSAILLVGFWLLTSYIAEIVLSVVAGNWLLNLAKPTLGNNRFLSLLAGLILLALLSAVPYLGSIVGWVVVLLGVGALVCWMFRGTTTAKPTPDAQGMSSS